MTDCHRLTNGRYDVHVTAAGSGYSALGDYQLTRWSADRTRDADGFFAYLRDLDSGHYWSAGFQPVPSVPEEYRVTASADAVMIVRRDDGIEFRTEISVAPHADLEWRRYTVTNLGRQSRHLDLTTCAEVVLNKAAADAGHPAFSKLFVQTESLVNLDAVLALRRPRSPDDELLFLGHALLVVGTRSTDAPELETDRAQFIGRGRTLANPIVLATAGSAVWHRR